MPDSTLNTTSRVVHSTGLTNSSSGAIRPETARLVRLTDTELIGARRPVRREVADAQQDARDNAKEYSHRDVPSPRLGRGR